MCTSLLRGYRSRESKQKVFSSRKGFYDLPATVPCGQCMECRLKHSREKAMQCWHESETWKRQDRPSTVVTLTYASEHLPPNGSIYPAHAVKFMWDLRSHERYQAVKNGWQGGEGQGAPPKIKTYGCAEYGDKYQRPHYHIILFNYDFEDKEEHQGPGCKLCHGNQVCPGPGYYESDLLTEKWGKGRTQLMDLTFESAAYVARYITKKLNVSKASPEYIKRMAELKYTGRLEEQTVCMTQKGIGKEWYKEWKEEIYNGDQVYRNTKDGRRVPMAPPKYYDRQYELDHKQKWEGIKKKRRKENKKRLQKAEQEILNGNTTNAFNQGIGSRDLAKQICNEAKFAQLKRGYENEA